uniref:NADH-ubiquinone oxidoreductase chain 2 n=1 Tax=Godlewskia godlewskia TaxID=96615 RepID=A0A248RG69_9CAEN|nr:NADH dehydrogenase subunit 2 [Godlewskia godlewskia]ASU96531.1 NADH dehydrogenase subunit 2 [Godlewskia godlewskia]
MLSTLPFNLGFILMMLFGTLFSISSSHWLGIWVGLEMNLIGFIPLLIYQKTTSESESAVKYFIIQAMGSSLLMFASLNTYNMSFTWEMFNQQTWMLSFLVIIMALMLKTGMFPFYFWLPGVMAGLPWMSCLILTTWQKIAPLFLMTSLMESNLIYQILLIMCFFSVSSSLIGGIGGLNQTQVRALIAYSSIGHLGWIMFAMLHSSWSMKIYLSIYILISLSLFVNLWYSNLVLIKNSITTHKNMTSMGSTLIMLLSLGGLPPMLGFISKWLVITAATASPLWMILFGLIIGSVMSLFYYLSLSYSLFLSISKKTTNNQKMSLLTTLMVFMNCFGGVLMVLINTLIMY